MAEYTYRIIYAPDDYRAIYRRVRDEGLMATFNPGYRPSETEWVAMCMRCDVVVLGGYVDGELGGFLVGVAFSAAGPSRCMEVSVCSFRAFNEHAAALSRGAYLWVFDHLDAASMVGRIIDTNRHVKRMAPHVGFQVLGKIPGLFWSEKKKNFRDGYFVRATRETVQAAIDREGK